MQKKWLAYAGGAVVAVVVLVVGAFFAARSKAYGVLDQAFPELQGKDLPVPFPLTDAEVAELRDEARARLQAEAAATDGTTAEVVDNGDQAPAPDPSGKAEPAADPLEGVDLDALALERAVERGSRIANTRAGCGECHGTDGGGKTILDVAMLGTWVAPNITTGRPSPLTPAQWDLAVRHGVAADGTRSSMPSKDYAMWADRDVSDLIAYYQSLPPQDRQGPPLTLGPIFTMLTLQGQIGESVDQIDHAAERPTLPPDPAASVEFGAYLGSVCMGCHGNELSGGPIPGGDPAWPPALNLTPHETGTRGWTLEQFDQAVRMGQGSKGTLDKASMPWPTFNGLSDVEVEALYKWTQSLEPKEYGGR